MAARKHAPFRPEAPERILVEDLVKNGRKRYAWRMVDGVPALVVVALRFTVAADAGEDDRAFEQRMIRHCLALADGGFPVVVMDLESRDQQGKRPWALFECSTPAAKLQPIDV